MSRARSVYERSAVGLWAERGRFMSGARSVDEPSAVGWWAERGRFMSRARSVYEPSAVGLWADRGQFMSWPRSVRSLILVKMKHYKSPVKTVFKNLFWSFFVVFCFRSCNEKFQSVMASCHLESGYSRVLWCMLFRHTSPRPAPMWCECNSNV